MYLNLNPNAVGIRVDSVDKLLRLAAESGFGGVDLPVEQIPTAEAAGRAAEVAAALGLQWGLFPLPCDFLKVDDEKFEWGLGRLEAILPRVRRAGGHRTYNHVWPGSQEMDQDENFAWHVDRVSRLHRVLRGHGVMLGLEFIGPKTLRDTFRFPFIHTLEGVLQLADAVSSEVGIVFDTFHWYTSGGSLDEFRTLLSGDRIVNVHVNDAVAGRDREEQQDLERAMPLATGVIDAAAVLSVLREKRYRGPVMCEPFQPELTALRAMSPAEAAARVGASLQQLLERSRKR